MYDLGEQFKFDLNKSISNPECVFKGSKYRITHEIYYTMLLDLR